MLVPAKIAFVDIETAPSLGYVWAKWETNVIEFKRDWYMLSYAVKWVGDKQVTTRCLADYPGFKRDMEDDSRLVKDLWKVFDEADILIAHNGDGFDILKSNTRFILHGLPPPSPYKTIDTLKIARKVFKFDSNKLDELGQYFGVGRKLPHTGFNLWKGCMKGDPKSWAIMKQYNGHDVELLEKIYYLMQAWAPGHPNVTQGKLEACPRCASIKIEKRGFSYTQLSRKQRYRCQDCSGWFESGAKRIK